MFQRSRPPLDCAEVTPSCEDERVMNGYLRELTDRFPERELEIVRLVRDNPVFRSVCEEMEIAEAALARWKDLPDRASEYREILERLEEEFLRHLSGNASATEIVSRNYSGD